MLGSLRASLWKQWRDHESVDGLTGIQETGANLDRESVVSTIFSSQSKGKGKRVRVVEIALHMCKASVTIENPNFKVLLLVFKLSWIQDSASSRGQQRSSKATEDLQ